MMPAQPDKSPSTTIIILNWNGLEDTIECLQSIYNLDYDNFSVVVVDNASDKDPSQILKENFPTITVIRNQENIGYAGGNNVGIQYALTQNVEYVWLLNNDATVEPNTLRKLIHTAEQNKTAGLLSPLIRDYQNQDEIQACGGYLNWDTFEFGMLNSPDAWMAELNAGCAYLWGTALLIRRSVIEDIGLLDQKYFAYTEDRQYCYRALRKGYSLILDTHTNIYHKWAQASGGDLDSPGKVFLMTRNNYFFWMENLRSMDKIRFLRRYLLRSIQSRLKFEENNKMAVVRQINRAIWYALRNKGGGPDECGEIPGWANSLFFNHPYFWRNLLDGNYRTIAASLKNKLIKPFSR